jgi:5-methylcytosine-specific restriction enzyme subunit McrC
MDTLGNALYQNFRNYVAVEFPTPKTDGKWEFKPLGWVGTIPVTESISISLQPKAPLENLFRMWEYAYRLKNFRFFDNVVGCQSLLEFYQNLADILAKKVLARVQKGLYRTYIDRAERLPYVSGRLDIRRMASEPWRVDLDCAFEEHTTDVEENHILCWTLSVIARSGLCSDPAILSRIRRAYRELLGCVIPTPVLPKACVGRLYNRLNDDYEPLHSLCRFFLEHRGPTHRHGDYAMMPFLMDMARLFELFVAEWLRQNLPPELELKEQHTVNFGASGELQFRIDVVILDRATGTPRYILDTKYKVPDSAGSPDIHEVRSYAEALGCTEAALIYPIELQSCMNVKAGNIRVRTLTFAVGGDIDEGGKAFLSSLLEQV